MGRAHLALGKNQDGKEGRVARLYRIKGRWVIYLHLPEGEAQGPVRDCCAGIAVVARRNLPAQDIRKERRGRVRIAHGEAKVI